MLVKKLHPSASSGGGGSTSSPLALASASACNLRNSFVCSCISSRDGGSSLVGGSVSPAAAAENEAPTAAGVRARFLETVEALVDDVAVLAAFPRRALFAAAGGAVSAVLEASASASPAAAAEDEASTATRDEACFVKAVDALVDDVAVLAVVPRRDRFATAGVAVSAVVGAPAPMNARNFGLPIAPVRCR